MSAVVTLKRAREERSSRAVPGFLIMRSIRSWEVLKTEIVVVHDFDGYPMGKGFINTNSKIRIRMLTRHVDQEIDRTFYRCA